MSLNPDRKGAAVRSIVENVIDLEHLDQYTLGDRTLQAELLQLFRTQLKNQTNILMSCGTEVDWKSAAHTLKGAAHAIGAGQVRRVAETMETIPFTEKGGRDALVKQLKLAGADFESQVERYL